MAPRLPRPAPAGPFDPSAEANHRAMCRAWSAAMFGRAAEVARVTGLCPRSVEYNMQPQGQQEGCLERGVRLILALRLVSRAEQERALADLPLHELCRQLGGRFVANLDEEPAESGIRTASGAQLASAKLTSAALEILEDDEVDPLELERYHRAKAERRRQDALLDRGVELAHERWRSRHPERAAL